jgi:hypothetical protein
MGISRLVAVSPAKGWPTLLLMIEGNKANGDAAALVIDDISLTPSSHRSSRHSPATVSSVSDIVQLVATIQKW